jgi:hypothetical protein
MGHQRLTLGEDIGKRTPVSNLIHQLVRKVRYLYTDSSWSLTESYSRKWEDFESIELWPAMQRMAFLHFRKSLARRCFWQLGVI